MKNAALDTAVRNTLGTPGKTDAEVRENTSVDGLTMGQVVSDDNLRKQDLKVAYEAIDKAYTIQWGAGGIIEVEEKLKGLQGKISEHVYDVAKVAMERCKGKLIVARAYFQALCEKAEQHIQNVYTEKYKEEMPMGKLIPLWSQYKSKFAKGMEKGIDPMARDEQAGSLLYATAGQYRKAVDDAEAKDRETGSQAGNGRASNADAKTSLQLVTKGWSTHLGAAMQVLCQELNRLLPEEQDRFADDILSLGAKVKGFADTMKRETLGDNRTENQKAAGVGASLPAAVADDDGMDDSTQRDVQAALDAEQNKEAGKGNKRQRKARAA